MKFYFSLIIIFFSGLLQAQTVDIKYAVDNEFIFNKELVTRLSTIKEKEFLSFSLRVNDISEIDKVQIYFTRYFSTGEKSQSILKTESHSYQEETKNASGSFISELIYLEKGIDSISISVASNAGLIIGKSMIICRIYDPFFGINQITEPKTDTVGCEKPQIRKRSDWNCPDGDSCLHGTLIYTTVTHLIVHHSAGSNTSSNWDAVLRSIWDYHVNTNGWIDIGYNYLIDPNGVVYEGRAGGDNVVGAHFSAMNSHTMGVCVIGTYTSVLPTLPALKNTARILGWKAQLENIGPFDSAQHQAGFIPQIAGHRDSGNGTECPGNAFYPYLPQLRQQVSDCLNGVLSITQSDSQLLLIYPIPAFDNITVHTDFPNSSLNIYDIVGKQVFACLLTENQTIDVSDFPPGMYFFVLLSDQGTQIIKVPVE